MTPYDSRPYRFSHYYSIASTFGSCSSIISVSTHSLMPSELLLLETTPCLRTFYDFVVSIRFAYRLYRFDLIRWYRFDSVRSLSISRSIKPVLTVSITPRSQALFDVALSMLDSSRSEIEPNRSECNISCLVMPWRELPPGLKRATRVGLIFRANIQRTQARSGSHMLVGDPLMKYNYCPQIVIFHRQVWYLVLGSVGPAPVIASRHKLLLLASVFGQSSFLTRWVRVGQTE